MTTSTDLPVDRVVWDDAGCLGLGVRLDGGGTAWFDLADDVTASSGLITGPPGSGRSNAATLLAATARAHLGLRVSTLYADAHAGLSNRLLARHAARVVPGEVVISALERVAEARLAARSAPPRPVPILFAVVEDAERVVGSQPHRWRRLARRAAVARIAVLAVPASDLDAQPGHRALWRQLAHVNHLRLYSPADPGRGEFSNLLGDVDRALRVTYLPAAEAEPVLAAGMDAELDPPAAAALAEFTTS